METSEIIKICRDRNEIDFLFSITKQIAETDSIGEGYRYCSNYTEEQFNNAEKRIQSDGRDAIYCEWLEDAGAPIYELYLHQIGVLPKQNTT